MSDLYIESTQLLYYSRLSVSSLTLLIMGDFRKFMLFLWYGKYATVPNYLYQHLNFTFVMDNSVILGCFHDCRNFDFMFFNADFVKM